MPSVVFRLAWPMICEMVLGEWPSRIILVVALWRRSCQPGQIDARDFAAGWIWRLSALPALIGVPVREENTHSRPPSIRIRARSAAGRGRLLSLLLVFTDPIFFSPHRPSPRRAHTVSIDRGPANSTPLPNSEPCHCQEEEQGCIWLPEFVSICVTSSRRRTRRSFAGFRGWGTLTRPHGSFGERRSRRRIRVPCSKRSAYPSCCCGYRLEGLFQQETF
jgi:hypothetical protein